MFNIKWTYMLWLSSALYFLILTCIFFHFNNFFDFTDSSFYWLHTKYAEFFSGVTQFGHYTGIIYRLSFENILIHRVVSASLLLAAFFYMAFYVEKVINQVIKENCTVNKNIVWLMTSFSLFFYGKNFNVGVSYNWLSFLGAIIFLGGLFSLLDKNSDTRYLIYKYLYLSLGGWLAWNAKPTVAVGLVFILCAFLLLHYKKEEIKKLQLLMWSSVFIVMFLCMHIILFEKGLNVYIDEYRRSLELMDVLGGHKATILQKILELWTQYISILAGVISKKVVWIVIVAVVYLKVRFWRMHYANKSTNKSEEKLLLISTFLLLITFISVETGFGLRQLSLTVLYYYTVFLCVGLINLDMEIVVYKKQDKITEVINKKIYLVGLSVLLMLTPLAIVVGTNNTYSKHMYGFVGFILLAIYMLIKSSQFLEKKSSVFILLCGVISVIFVLNGGMKSPYRMPESVYTETYKTEFLTDNNNLSLNKKAYEYVSKLKQLALDNGWKVKNNLIDLTGGTPGAALVLGAIPSGSAAWLLGAYPGSNKFAKLTLANDSLDSLSGAWILTTPDGRRKIDASVLTDLDLDFPSGYIKTGEIYFDYHRKEIHYLWMPRLSN